MHNLVSTVEVDSVLPANPAAPPGRRCGQHTPPLERTWRVAMRAQHNSCRVKKRGQRGARPRGPLMSTSD